MVFVPPTVTPVRTEDLVAPTNLDLGPTEEKETLVVAEPSVDEGIEEPLVEDLVEADTDSELVP